MHQTGGTAAEARRKLTGDAAAVGRTLPWHCAVVLADASRPAPTPAPVGCAAPTRHRLVTTDPEVARSELVAAYGTPIRMAASASGGTFRLEHTDADLFQTGDQQLPGALDFASEPASQVVVGQLLAGAVSRGTPSGEERLTAGDVFLTGRPATVHTAATHDAHVQTVTLPLTLLHKVAGQLPDQSGPLRFAALRASSPGAADRWRATAACTATLLERPEYATRLVVANAAQLLAATALAVFRNSAAASPDLSGETADATPLTVRRAAAFIEAHADRDITLADIAGAAFVTPRALQYAFRRHLGTTPLASLRDVRLRRAHRDLVDADPALTTVSKVAARWGFLHAGRFAARYQDLYHCPPSTTLHA